MTKDEEARIRKASALAQCEAYRLTLEQLAAAVAAPVVRDGKPSNAR